MYLRDFNIATESSIPTIQYLFIFFSGLKIDEVLPANYKS